MGLEAVLLHAPGQRLPGLLEVGEAAALKMPVNVEEDDSDDEAPAAESKS